MEKLVDMSDVSREAIRSVEESGIVFIDEIDKICNPGDYRGADASAEGVQVRVCERESVCVCLFSLCVCYHSLSLSLTHTHTIKHTHTQRDLLPLIEGCTISTKYGNVNTDYVLFISSGAFHQCKPSDLLAELQGACVCVCAAACAYVG